MLVWGSAGKTADGGDAGIQPCQVCKEPRPFRYLVSYKMHHIWYLIRWATSTRYYAVCGVCNNAFDSAAPETAPAGIADTEKPKNPVPAFDRWGWAFGLGAVALLVTLGGIMSKFEDQADAKLLASPHVGDLYEVNMDSFLGEKSSATNSTSYGVVRVSAVDGEKAKIDLPAIVYDQLKGAGSDMRDKALQDAYYNETVEINIAQLRELDAKGAVIDVDRHQ
jgi:hypothetical protein